MTNKNTIWDPLRKKEVALTPEEKVRQWCIGILAGRLAVPMHMMMSEAPFRLGEKKYRADIIVYDRKVRPMVVVECKRPEVELSSTVLDQAIRYNMVLDVKYMIITNGRQTCVCRRVVEDGKRKYVFIDDIPAYQAMLDEVAADETAYGHA